MRILLIEDNRQLNNSLRLSLVDDGYAVDVAFDGVEGEELAEITPYDVIILDIMLPKKNGLDVCRSLRNDHVNTPILMLTARDALEDRVAGFDLCLLHISQATRTERRSVYVLFLQK